MTGNIDIWNLMYQKLSEHFPGTVGDLWFSGLGLVAMDDTQCILVSDSDMKAHIINTKYADAAAAPVHRQRIQLRFAKAPLFSQDR